MTCETCGAVWCRARNLCSRDGCERGERAMWGLEVEEMDAGTVAAMLRALARATPDLTVLRNRVQ